MNPEATRLGFFRVQKSPFTAGEHSRPQHWAWRYIWLAHDTLGVSYYRELHKYGRSIIRNPQRENRAITMRMQLLPGYWISLVINSMPHYERQTRSFERLHGKVLQLETHHTPRILKAIPQRTWFQFYLSLFNALAWKFIKKIWLL
jgi:hypothetical protein